MKKAITIEPTRTDLLVELAKEYVKLKRFEDASVMYKSKIDLGKGVKAVDYFEMGRALFFAQRFQSADSAFTKVLELTPNYATGYLYSAKAKSRLDSTSALGLAKPPYEKFVEIVEADTASLNKQRENLKEAYSYLASYAYIQLKDKAQAIMYLKRKAAITMDPSEKKEIETQITQIEEQIRGKKP